jgi:hypothetical protein
MFSTPTESFQIQTRTPFTISSAMACPSRCTVKLGNPVVGEILGTNVALGLAVLHDDPKTAIVLVQSREDKILHAKVSDGRCSMYCSVQDDSFYLMEYTEVVLAWGCS